MYAKWKSLKWWQKGLIIIGLIWLAGFFIPEPTAEEVAKAKSESAEAESQANRKQNLISAYIKAKNQLKDNLKDPKSFDELNREYGYLSDTTKEGGIIQVMIDYTATNTFGGNVRSKQVFIYDEYLNLVDTFETK